MAEIAITSTLLITTAESPGGPDHALHAVPAAAAANTSGYFTPRFSTAWRAVNRIPPASQARRSQSAGISPASARSARSHARCSADSIGSEYRSSATITFVSHSMAPPQLHVGAGLARVGLPGLGRPTVPEPMLLLRSRALRE